MKCHTDNCKELPMLKVYWPGKAMFVMCGSCADRAVAVSQAMGFHLVVEPLATQEEEPDAKP